MLQEIEQEEVSLNNSVCRIHTVEKRRNHSISSSRQNVRPLHTETCRRYATAPTGLTSALAWDRALLIRARRASLRAAAIGA